jgi:adenylyltransferase/sulfurtransferase
VFVRLSHAARGSDGLVLAQSPCTLAAMQDLPPLEITVQETRDLLASGAAWLLDVREPSEFETCRIEGSTLIPMREIPARLAEIPRDMHVLVQCHHGGRSLRVTQFLRAQGLQMVSNVAGGIEAWSLEIDPSVPRY